jgi:hypothetical protein
MGKADVWNEVDILKKHEKKIWHIHPVKFRDHLDNAKLLDRNVENLLYIQDMVVKKLKCLEKGAWGMYPPEGYEKKPPPAKQTYCNQAVFLTVTATDGNYNNFTDRKKEKPGVEYPFPELFGEKAIEYEEKYDIKSSNFWCDELRRMAAEGRLVELSPQEAQRYGNMGYTVVASSKARNRKEWSPHFATVRPREDFDKYGPMVANVGENNLFGRAKNEECFGKRYETIEWYYNPNQDFRLDPKWIEFLERKYG